MRTGSVNAKRPGTKIICIAGRQKGQKYQGVQAFAVKHGRKAKVAEELTKKKIDENHAKIIIMAFLDDETLKHTAQHQELSVSLFKVKVLEFINMMDSSSTGNGARLHHVDEMDKPKKILFKTEGAEEWDSDVSMKSGGEEESQREEWTDEDWSNQDWPSEEQLFAMGKPGKQAKEKAASRVGRRIASLAIARKARVRENRMPV